MKLKNILNFLLRKPQERELFLTHTPSYYQPGMKTSSGVLITRIERVGDTALVNGGRAPCWRVWGGK